MRVYQMKKSCKLLMGFILVTLSLALLTCDIVNPVKVDEITRNNPFDSGSDEFDGVVSEDRDGDGVGDFADVDEIVMWMPENGSTIGDITPELTIKPKSKELNCTYCFLVSLNPDLTSPIISVPRISD